MNTRSALLPAILLAVLFLAPPSTAPAQEQLVLGLPAYVSTTELYARFGPLADHLSKALKIPVKLRSEVVYENHLTNLQKGDVDIAFLGPASYVIFTKRFGAVPLLAGYESSGKKSFRGFIVVKKDSPITALAQLKGKRFAFGDINSTMGSIVPRYLLLKAGIDLKRLGSYKFMDNQENVALGVLSGNYDAGAVREDMYTIYGPEGLRAIASSDSLPTHLFVARRGLPEALRAKIAGILLSLKDSPEGRAVLSALQKNLTALVPVSDAEYAPIRKIMDYLAQAGIPH